MTTISVQHLNAWYGNAQALFDINLAMPERSITALMGPSGCGKSTFIRTLNRMHEEVPGARITGEVMVDNVDIYGRNISAQLVRRHIGMVFQRPNPIPTRSIADNVSLGPMINSTVRGNSLRNIVEQSLRRAALWDEVKDRLNAPAGRLSGGQQQRLCIARALALQPEIVLMDEPTSALDPLATLQIEELVRDLKKTYTIVMVTHNLQQATRIADTTAFFLLGALIEARPTSELFSHPTRKETEDYITGRFS